MSHKPKMPPEPGDKEGLGAIEGAGSCWAVDLWPRRGCFIVESWFRDKDTDQTWNEFDPVVVELSKFPLTSTCVLPSINTCNKRYFHCFELSGLETDARINMTKTGTFVAVRLF